MALHVKATNKECRMSESTDDSSFLGWRFATRSALVQTAVTLIALVALAGLFGESTLENSRNCHTSLDAVKSRRYDESKGNIHCGMPEPKADTVRLLEEEENGDNGDNGDGNDGDEKENDSDEIESEDNGAGNDDDVFDGDEDYSLYSCGSLWEYAPDPGRAQCRFARTCNQNEGVWAPWVFCKPMWLSTTTLCIVLSPIMLLWLVLLFRMLGSTSEDFFSPSLEMFSVKLGLPPRFAGVSLLALGNGAADVSATVNAIMSDQKNGYKLALGALTGSAMMVGGVVAAFVILTAKSVPCRGALVRDVSFLILTVFVVWTQLGGSGEVGSSTVSMFISLYCVFVVLVLIADVYHRRVVLPRIAAQGQAQERQRQLEQEAEARAAAGDALNKLAGKGVQPAPQNGEGTVQPEVSHATAPNQVLSTVMTAISNYDNEEAAPTNRDASNIASEQEDGWGMESDSIMLHGAQGILNTTPPHPSDTENAAMMPETPYSMLEDGMDQFCHEPGSVNISATNWHGAWNDGKEELRVHFNQLWDDIAWNGDVHPVEKVLLICEFPFTVLRKATISVPCPGYYVRALVALSLATSPFWMIYYLWHSHDISPFQSGWYLWIILWAIAIFCGASVLRYGPGGNGLIVMGVAAPIALYGFAIAATWIDFIASHLVSLLDFLGIILHIPPSVMGLTVLAWGNSMGDLSANITMARKGLANMAMTASFAGPVFNILIGLGWGFSSLLATTQEEFVGVKLGPSVVTGFVFIFLNCIAILVTGLALFHGHIPHGYGYVALVLYTVYVLTSVSLQYSKYGDQ